MTIFPKMRRLALLSLAVVALAASAYAQTPEALTARAAATPQPAAPASKATLEVTLSIKPPFHVNSNPASEPYLIPVTVAVKDAGGVKAGKPVYPPGKLKKFGFSDKPLSIYEGDVMVKVPLEIGATAKEGDVKLSGAVRYQACNDKNCFPPATAKFSAVVTVGSKAAGDTPAAGTANANGASSGLSGLLHDPQTALGSAPLWLTLIGVFVLGLGLNLTPCVYPMVPITVGYFGAQSEGRLGKTFSLALLYVLGLAIVYSSLGVFAAVSNKMFGSIMQKPYVVGAIALIFFVAALSMLGLFTIPPPQFLMSKSGAKEGALGALSMGALLGVVSAPCTGPVTLGLLAYVGTSRNMMLGFLLFFVLSLGLGLPYLLLGTFSGAIKALPRSGVWLERTKKLFAVPLLLAAFYYSYQAWHVYSVGKAQQQMVSRRQNAAEFADSLRKQYRVVGIPAIVFVDGSGAERRDLRAGEGLTASTMVERLNKLKVNARSAGIQEPTIAEAVGKETHWPRATPEALELAKSQRVPVVLDFRADWCAPCREIEKKVFSQPAVKQAGRGVMLLQVDLTAI